MTGKTYDRPRQDREAHLPVARVGGRYVTAYNPEIALQIVERIAQGETISAICAKGSGMPHPVTFKRWVVNQPDLARALDAARKISAQSLEEEAIDAAREIKRAQRDGTQVRAVEVLLNQLRWSAERRDPGQFGTKAPISVRVPITIVSSLDMGKAQGQILDGNDVYKLSVTRKTSENEAIEASYQDVSDNPLVEASKKWSEKSAGAENLAHSPTLSAKTPSKTRQRAKESAQEQAKSPIEPCPEGLGPRDDQ